MTSLYIHIPFCKKKCDYCDFVSYAGKEKLIDNYVKNIIKEIHNCSLFIDNCSLKTIYIGGGTPTLLAPDHFERIVQNVAATFRLPYHGGLKTAATLEITVEANPGTADKKKLKALRELGVNRLSIGAQTFNDRHLKTLGRIHNSADIFRFYEDARSVGFDNINLDLIFALPGQTLTEWETDLKCAIGLNPNHLSTYNLTIEEGTPLHRRISKSEYRNSKQLKNSKFEFVSDFGSLDVARDAEPVEAFRDSNLTMSSEDEAADMFEYTIDSLQAAGFRHYEISNFCRPGYECRHNINYWENGNYLGIGAGAHSHVNGKRWANPDSIEEYLRQTKPTNDPRDVTETDIDKRETLFLGLRLIDGLSIDHFAGFDEEVGQLLREGLLQRNNGHYQLTRRGIMLGNRVFSRFV
jgi:oxygen-independent coproporphyrinogen-3 oxidase